MLLEDWLMNTLVVSLPTAASCNRYEHTQKMSKDVVLITVLQKVNSHGNRNRKWDLAQKLDQNTKSTQRVNGYVMNNDSIKTGSKEVLPYLSWICSEETPEVE